MHLVGFIIRILLLSVFLAVLPISLFEIVTDILAYVSAWSIKCSNDDNSE